MKFSTQEDKLNQGLWCGAGFAVGRGGWKNYEAKWSRNQTIYHSMLRSGVFH
jgi:hypothetical protein